MPKEASQQARFNGAHTFGVTTPTGGENGHKKLFYFFYASVEVVGGWWGMKGRGEGGSKEWEGGGSRLGWGWGWVRPDMGGQRPLAGGLKSPSKPSAGARKRGELYTHNLYSFLILFIFTIVCLYNTSL